jgi:hypothetical protein
LCEAEIAELPAAADRALALLVLRPLSAALGFDDETTEGSPIGERRRREVRTLGAEMLGLRLVVSVTLALVSLFDTALRAKMDESVP